jgi:hypothetical protein
MLGTGDWAASHLNYLEAQPRSACTAGLEPFGAQPDWNIHSGSTEARACGWIIRCGQIYLMPSASENCGKSTYLTLHQHFLMVMYMKSFFNRSKNTIVHIM